MRVGLWKYILLGVVMTGVPGSMYAVYGGGEETRDVKGMVVAVERAEEVATSEPTMTPIPRASAVPTKKPVVATATPVVTATPTAMPTETPVPGPTTTPDVWSPAELEPVFTKYANEYGVDKNVLERLANCESHFNPNAVYGPYVGMFQFDSITWQKYRGMMGLDINCGLRTDIEESIRTAAFVVQQSGTGLWPRCL